MRTGRLVRLFELAGERNEMMGWSEGARRNGRCELAQRGATDDTHSIVGGGRRLLLLLLLLLAFPTRLCSCSTLLGVCLGPKPKDLRRSAGAVNSRPPVRCSAPLRIRRTALPDLDANVAVSGDPDAQPSALTKTKFGIQEVDQDCTLMIPRFDFRFHVDTHPPAEPKSRPLHAMLGAV